MISMEVYGRIRLDVPADAERIEIQAPSGETYLPLIFTHRDADFTYDMHGYETVTLRGEARKQVAFSAITEGTHILRAYRGDVLLQETIFNAFAPKGKGHGYVEVSRRDPRYFAFTDGTSYVPVGVNLIGCDYDRLSSGEGHFKSSNNTATTGMIQWRRWFRELKEASGNYARIWLSSRYTEARTSLMGVHDPVALARFDALIELARESGIRLKLCLEHWRKFTDTDHFAYRYYINPDTGLQLKDENEWFKNPVWNARWLKDIEPYLARCQNDPVVFAWELWNENECGRGSFEAIAGFTERMLPEIKRISPMNLVVNSLGSFDAEGCQKKQDYFRDMEAMDFQQVHRYLDQGAPLDICHTDPVEFSIDAVIRSRRDDKPVILTETGAVNDCHTGPFRFYACDHDGLIFHDVTYPALFAGAAGSGHIWHWNQYVEQKNLWRHFRPLASLLEGIQMDEEQFVSRIIQDENAWILTLTGLKHTLVLVRNKADRWDKVLRDGIKPMPVGPIVLPIPAENAKAYWLMDEQPGEPAYGDTIILPAFLHGCVLKITNFDKCYANQ